MPKGYTPLLQGHPCLGLDRSMPHPPDHPPTCLSPGCVFRVSLTSGAEGGFGCGPHLPGCGWKCSPPTLVLQADAAPCLLFVQLHCCFTLWPPPSLDGACCLVLPGLHPPPSTLLVPAGQHEAAGLLLRRIEAPRSPPQGPASPLSLSTSLLPEETLKGSVSCAHPLLLYICTLLSLSVLFLFQPSSDLPDGAQLRSPGAAPCDHRTRPSITLGSLLALLPALDLHGGRAVLRIFPPRGNTAWASVPCWAPGWVLPCPDG